MKHTFASSSRHPASRRLSLVILGICVAAKKPTKMFVMQNIFVLRAIHFSIGHLLLSGFFALKAVSFPNAGCFHVSDACNPDACNQRSISILG
jgi:hypothetical protein